MTVVISGTAGIQNVLGSAAAPAESNTTSSNTGMYFPTSTTLGFSTAGTNAVTIDASQNVGIGVTPNSKLDISGSTSAANRSLRMIPTTEAATVPNLRTSTIQRTSVDSLLAMGYCTTPDAWYISASYGSTGAYKPLAFATSDVEAMRIDTSGNLLVGTTNTSLTAGVGVKLIASATEPYISYVINSAGGSSYHLYNTNATNNGYRFYVTTNGGIANYSANNVNLSDERTKTDIQNAGSYLAKICAIPVRTFKYKDQADDLLNLGVIAQEVESIAPELVDVLGFGETPEDGIPLKSIYQTDLQYALMKCIQEQQALITSLTARIEALEAR